MKKIFTLLAATMMIAFSSQAAYYLVGNPPFGTGWSPNDGVEMTANGDGTYSFKATVNGSIWFVFTDQFAAPNDWTTFNNEYRIGPTSGDETVTVGNWIDTQRSGGDHGAYKFEGSGGEYVITLNPAIMKFKIEGYVEPWELKDCTVAGTPASVFGTEWDENNTDNDMVLQEDGTYLLVKHGCELAEGSELQFKVVGNHDWGHCWPEDNMVVPIEKSAIYMVTFTFNPATFECGAVVEVEQEFNPLTGELYILGEANGNAWAPNVGVKMTKIESTGAGENAFGAVITTDGANIDENDGIGYSYFAFTTMLGDDWNAISAYRIGAPEADFLLSEDLFGTELNLSNFAATNSYKIPAGKYDLTVDLDKKVMTIDNHAAVDELVAGKAIAGVRYYNVMGQETANPAGVTIAVTTYTDGTTVATKVVK